MSNQQQIDSAILNAMLAVQRAGEAWMELAYRHHVRLDVQEKAEKAASDAKGDE